MNLRSLSWTTVSQACASLSNLLLSIFVARYSSLEAFGAYGIAFATYLLAVGVMRALVGDPALLRWSEWNDADARLTNTHRKRAASACILVSLLFSFVVVIIGRVVGGEIAEALTMMALILPIVLCLDVMRYWSFAEGKARFAAFLDSCWLIVQVAFFGLLALVSSAQMPLIILAWGLAAAVPVLIFGLHQCWRLGIADAMHWLRQNGPLSRTYLAEFMTLVGVQQSATYLVLIFAGLPATGSLRSAQTIMGPVNIVTGSTNVAVIPRARAIWRDKPQGLRPFAIKVSLALFCFVAVSSLCIQLIPASIGQFFLGESWVTGRAVAALLALSLSFSAITYGASIGLRVMELSKVSLKIRLISAPITFIAVLIGASAWGVYGAVSALAISAFIQMFVWWSIFLTANRRKAT